MVRQILLTMAVILLTACASSQPRDLGGFSGYSFGATSDFISEDMAADGRELEDSSERALWYHGQLEGHQVEFAYVFENGMLVSGLWMFEDTSLISFQSIEDLLLRTYSTSAVIVDKDGVTSHEHYGPDARIVHVLDSREPRHAVHYYFADTAAEEATRL